MKKRGFGLIVIILLLFIPIYVKAERGNKELNSIKINSTVNNVNIKIFKVADILDSECHLNDNLKIIQLIVII